MCPLAVINPKGDTQKSTLLRTIPVVKLVLFAQTGGQQDHGKKITIAPI